MTIKTFLQDHGVTVSESDNLTQRERNELKDVLYFQYGVSPNVTEYGLAYHNLFPDNVRELLFGSDDTDPVMIGIAIDPSSISMLVDDTVPYSVMATFDDDNIVSVTPDTFSTEDPTIATATEGAISGLQEGITTLTVTVGEFTTTADIVVDTI